MKKGLLLINLGTPKSPRFKDVWNYLREFLSDRRVIDLPWPLRYLLVYAIILPTRTKKSSHAYQAIWTESGSPLRYHSENLCQKLKTKLEGNYQVAFAMRYGKPELNDALKELKNCGEITVLPLYPQYSSAATGSAIEYFLKTIERDPTFPSINIIRDFYNHQAFINALALQIKPYIEVNDHILFSYHGIPERHLVCKKLPNVCKNACPIPSEKNQNQTCYRAQCFATTGLIAQKLKLDANKYTTSFQSRLGKTPWIKPYTDNILSNLAKQGIKKLAVVCPAFVTDCLETLEEIGIRALEDWKKLGGESLSLIPCLNDSDAWCEAIKEIALNH